MTGQFIISVFDSIPTWVMLLPIFICSVAVLAVFIERMIFFYGINIDYRLLMASISAKLREAQPESALALCAPYKGPLVEMIRQMIASAKDEGDSELTMRNIAEKAVRSVERFGTLIATIGTVAPMFGLLGTVTGMMKSFSSLSDFGRSSHDLLAQGITEALITTALGLTVAIPAIIFYNYLVSKVEVFTKEAEYIANIFIELEKTAA